MTAEPDMESLLASIRKAIDSDIGENTRSSLNASNGTAFKGVMREARVKFEEAPAKQPASEILELRNKINRTRTESAIAEPPPRYSIAAPTPMPTPRTGFAGILGGDVPVRPPASRNMPAQDIPNLRPSFAERPARRFDNPPAYKEPETYQDEAIWQDEAQSYLPAVQESADSQDYAEAPLMSADSTVAASSAFNQLADTLMVRALGERSIEDMTHDLLKGMLKTWLDNNLPSLVEKLVREEIERVARRGR